MSSKINLLVTSSGDKSALINNLHKNLKLQNINLFVGDYNENVSTSLLDYDFLKLPKIPNDASVIDNFLSKHNINFIIPTRDPELLFWSKFDEIYHPKYKIIISNLQNLTIAEDKLIFSETLQKHGHSAIQTYNNFTDKLPSKFVVKERIPTGNNKTKVFYKNVFSKNLIAEYDNPIFQPFIEGDEISIDAYGSFNSENIFLICRYRTHIQNGESFVTKTFSNPAIEKQAYEILSILNLKGPIMLQGILDRKGRVHWMECNPRFGGASNCGIHMGLDVWNWSINEKLDNLFVPTFRKNPKEITMYKSIQDNFLEQ